MENNLLNIAKFIEQWASQYPYDFLWRKKYNVPFGSDQHKNTTHIQMLIDLYEDRFYKNLIKMQDSHYFDESKLEEVRTGTSGKSVVVSMSQSEIDEEFDKLDLSQFNDK